MADLRGLVSIVIPAYNVERTIGRAIESVLGQAYEAIEIIVVDDGSTNATSDVCRTYGEKIRYIRQENQGVSAARNKGIEHAMGEYIGFLDADDWYLPGKVEKLVSLLEKYPEAGAATGAFVARCADRDQVQPPPGQVFADGRKDGLIDYFECECRNLWVVHTNTILIRKTVLDTVGGFNARYRFGEDVDLWCRIAGRYSMAYLDEPIACYDRTSESSVCNMASNVLAHGLDHLYERRREKQYIDKARRRSYRRFKNRILLARLMLSIYEKDRGMLLQCLRKLNPLPPNIRVLLALAVLLLPVAVWPRNKRV
ncbi:glycosyltransferase [Pontiella sp.]|uniref:glycosyltransferase n=1 Tax=Pontiella sp. TaxID=2837462 RepID=UPI0035680347